MKALSEQDFYELLDVAPSASAAQIEAAFGRAMAYYGPDSLATYSLVSPEEAKRAWICPGCWLRGVACRCSRRGVGHDRLRRVHSRL